MRSESINELATALSKAQGMMNPATKSVENTYFKSKYADLPAVWEAARAALSSNGLAVIQTTEQDGDNMFIVTILTHTSGQWIDGRYLIKPIKNDPQGVGSAFTYARRYAFSAMVGVTAEGDDDDGNAASGNNAKPETATSRNKRYEALKKSLAESSDPADTWHGNIEAINGFRDSLGDDYYQQLITVAGKRKAELASDSAMKEGMPQGFKETR